MDSILRISSFWNPIDITVSSVSNCFALWCSLPLFAACFRAAEWVVHLIVEYHSYAVCLNCNNLKVKLSSQSMWTCYNTDTLDFDFDYWNSSLTHQSASEFVSFKKNSNSLEFAYCNWNAIACLQIFVVFAFQSFRYHKMCCFTNWWQSVNLNQIERQRKKSTITFQMFCVANDFVY